MLSAWRIQLPKATAESSFVYQERVVLPQQHRRILSILTEVLYPRSFNVRAGVETNGYQMIGLNKLTSLIWLRFNCYLKRS